MIDQLSADMDRKIARNEILRLHRCCREREAIIADMLEALQMAEKRLAELDARPGPWGTGSPTTLGFVRAAIAKAEGRT